MFALVGKIPVHVQRKYGQDSYSVFTGADDDTICSTYIQYYQPTRVDRFTLSFTVFALENNITLSFTFCDYTDGQFQCDFYILGGHDLIIYFPHYVSGNSSYNMAGIFYLDQEQQEIDSFQTAASLSSN